MFKLLLDLSGGFKGESEVMTGEQLNAKLAEGMFGARPYAVVVNGETVSWEAFKAISQLTVSALQSESYEPSDPNNPPDYTDSHLDHAWHG